MENYSFLSQIAFESEQEQEEIRLRGLAKLERGEMTPKSLKLGQEFKNKITAAYIPHVSVQKIDDEVGYGLFAEEELAPGCYAGEYTGIVRKNDRRYFEPLNNYCYEYPVPDPIGRSYVIDATSGNLTRFINHSYNPNLQPIHVFFDGFYHLIFLTKVRIPKGTQLSYDYGTNYWYLRQPPKDF